jgi:hypothetical protein
MCYEDNMAYFTRKWASDVLLRHCDSVCTALAMLVIIGGMEKNRGPGVKVEKILHVLRSGCERNLKSGTRCSTRGR